MNIEDFYDAVAMQKTWGREVNKIKNALASINWSGAVAVGELNNYQPVKDLYNKMEEKPMYVYVQFLGKGKTYAYKIGHGVSLYINKRYNIVADQKTNYNSWVKVVGFTNDKGGIETVRTITKAIPLDKESNTNGFAIKNVFFNEKEGVTVVLWDDGTKTILHCAQGEQFDREKGLALAYMKRYLGNKSNFNNVIKKYCF